MNGIPEASSTSRDTLRRENLPDRGELTCWLVDTRKLWPGKNIWSADGAAQMLGLTTTEEQTNISNKMFIQDARMSLASALLKRLYVSQTLRISWSQVRLGRRDDPKHGKPCAVDAADQPIQGIDFNVSHQAGLVALVGWHRGKQSHSHQAHTANFHDESQLRVGVDIVCVNERNDFRMIDSEGLESWIDMFEYVFSDEERWSMKYDVDYVTLPDESTLTGRDLGRHDRCMVRNRNISLTTPEGKPQNFSSALVVDAKVRRFYTYFCYTEAYVKLAGEALLAPWLKELQFFNVRSPKPARSSIQGPWGEEVEDVDVRLNRLKVKDVRMKIRAFENDFMIAAAIQGDIQNLQLPQFSMVDLGEDFRDFATTYPASNT